MKLIEVSAGLVFHAGRLLITQRRAGDHLGGLWEFPGGKREGEETFEACLQRELREELGIDITVVEEVESLVHHYPEKSVALKFFRCHWREGEAQPLGCQALAWVGAGELGGYAFPEADRRLLERLQKNPQWWQ